ncbi:MAG: acyloxyacyl hydrolase [Undibacterium sp.]
MFKLLCWCFIAPLLSCVARFSEAAEVIVMIDRLIYVQKSYSAQSPRIFGYIDSQGQLNETIYPGPCPNVLVNGFNCVPEDVIRQDQVRSLASLMIARSEAGLGWYGATGLWRWSTMKLRSDAALECGMRACWWHASEDFEAEQHGVVYAGGGIQYRFDWSRLSLTPSVGVVGHWPRIESVSGTNRLFQLGLRAGVKLSERSEVLLQYSHFSNGNRLKLADRAIANQGLEAVSLGFGYRF